MALSQAAFDRRHAAWEERMMDGLPQIAMYTTDEMVDWDHIPFIPQARHFDVENIQEYMDVIKEVNGMIVYFIHCVADHEIEDQRILASKLTFQIASRAGWTPNFMSYIGAQYLQRICLKFQRESDRAKQPGLPRAFHARDARYTDDVTVEEMRILANLVYAIGGTLFSSVAKIVGFSGVPGSSKTTIIEMVMAIAGGLGHVKLSTEYDDKYVCPTRSLVCVCSHSVRADSRVACTNKTQS